MAETNNEKKSYLVKIRKDDDGWLIAEVKDLPGCFASGEDLDELKEALEEAVGLYLSTSDVRVTVEFGEAERVFGVIDGDGDGEAEMPADFDFALAREQRDAAHLAQVHANRIVRLRIMIDVFFRFALVCHDELFLDRFFVGDTLGGDLDLGCTVDDLDVFVA